MFLVLLGFIWNRYSLSVNWYSSIVVWFSDWTLRNSDFDSRALAWSEEPKSFLENEKRRLSLYKALHPTFITEASTG